MLVDLARKILAGDTIDLAMGHFNVIWQGDNNAMTLLALEQVTSPPFVINVTGSEILSTREVSEAMGRLLRKKPNFCGTELETSCLGNAAKAHQLFGLPTVIAGRGNGTLKPGRHVKYADETPITNLYMSMLDKMGVPVDHIGDSTGKLEELSNL